MKHSARCLEVTMATQSEPPPRGSVENLSYLPQTYTYPTGSVGCKKTQKGIVREMQARSDLLLL